MYKEIIYEQDARDKIKNGVDTVSNAVKVTLGPKGRNVVFSSEGNTIVTNDGVTIASEIKAENKNENLGVSLIQ